MVLSFSSLKPIFCQESTRTASKNATRPISTTDSNSATARPILVLIAESKISVFLTIKNHESKLNRASLVEVFKISTKIALT